MSGYFCSEISGFCHNIIWQLEGREYENNTLTGHANTFHTRQIHPQDFWKNAYVSSPGKFDTVKGQTKLVNFENCELENKSAYNATYPNPYCRKKLSQCI